MPRSELRKNLLILALALTPLEAWATTVFVMSVTPSEVQLIIDRNVRVLRVGESSPEGVRLREVRGQAAVLEVGGRLLTLSIGQSTMAETQLRADARGRFVTQAHINGVPINAIIDTGADLVAINWDHARAMGIDWQRGQRTVTHTANGPVTAYVVTLASVRVGEVSLANVQAAVIEGGAERLPIALIGTSFLRHLEMRRTGNTMTLSRPNY